MEWQPIETAPKDGTWVLITGHVQDEHDALISEYERDNVTKETANRPLVARYRNEDYCYLSCVNPDFDEEPVLSMWDYAYWDSAWRSSACGPTHWMPLPDAPK